MYSKEYWKTKEGTAYLVDICKLLTFMGMGFFFYDIILSLKFDYSLLSGQRQRRWPQLAYFGARLSMLVYLALVLQVLFAKTEFACQEVFYVIEFFMGLVVCSSSVLLACRTICVYHGTARKVVGAVLIVLSSGLLAAWMQDVNSVRAEWLVEQAAPWNTGACTWLEVSDTYFVKYICTIVFDAVVLILTTIGIMQMNGGSRIGTILIRQGILYFVLTFMANLSVTVCTLLQLSATMALFFSPCQSVICTICASRLYVQLAEEAKQSHTTAKLSNSQQTSSFGSSRKFTSRFFTTTNPSSNRPSRLFSLNKGGSSFSTKQETDTSDSQPSYFPSSHDAGLVATGNTGTPFSVEDLEKQAPLNLTPSQEGRKQSGVYVQQERTIYYESDSSNNDVEHPYATKSGGPARSNRKSDDEIKDEQLRSQYPRLMARRENSGS